MKTVIVILLLIIIGGDILFNKMKACSAIWDTMKVIFGRITKGKS